jgi:hypothetical protein
VFAVAALWFDVVLNVEIRPRTHSGEGAFGVGGRGEIRTHERLAPLPVFKTGALNRSATLPMPELLRLSTLG